MAAMEVHMRNMEEGRANHFDLQVQPSTGFQFQRSGLAAAFLRFFQVRKRLCLPKDLAMAVGHHILAEPSIQGRKRGQLRLMCKAWKEECDMLTTRLAPAPCTTDCNLVRLVQMLPNLTSLDLSRCVLITDLGLHQLALLTGTLVELVLPAEGKFKANEAGVLQAVYSCSNLSLLDLGGLSISNAVLHECGNRLPSFVHLRSAAKDWDQWQAPLPWRALSGLESLRLPQAELLFSPTFVNGLTVLSALRHLELPETFVLDYGVLRKLSSLSRLTELTLRPSLNSQQVLELEQHCTQLRVITFHNYLFGRGYGELGRSSVRRLRRALPPDARVTVHFNWRVRSRVLLSMLLVALVFAAITTAVFVVPIHDEDLMSVVPIAILWALLVTAFGVACSVALHATFLDLADYACR